MYVERFLPCTIKSVQQGKSFARNGDEEIDLLLLARMWNSMKKRWHGPRPLPNCCCWGEGGGGGWLVGWWVGHQ